MSFFRFTKKPDELSREVIDRSIRRKLTEYLLGILTDKDGRIRAEDAISAAATIVAERCIEVIGEFSLREHDMVPGSQVFSDRINHLLCADVAEGGIQAIPKESVVGTLYRQLERGLFADANFPALSEVFRHYAENIGNATDWGRVPLSVGAEHLPFIEPLRVGYETRPHVDEILYTVHDDKKRCLGIATGTLAEILKMVAPAIDHRIALTLAIETINGMSKTAPMTLKAMNAAQEGNTETVG